MCDLREKCRGQIRVEILLRGTRAIYVAQSVSQCPSHELKSHRGSQKNYGKSKTILRLSKNE